MNRQFQAPRPSALWVADFTRVATWQGFVCVAFVIDTFARKIMGWRVSRAPLTPASSWTPWSRHDTTVGRPKAVDSFPTPTVARNTSPFGIPSASPKPVSSRPPAASAFPTNPKGQRSNNALAETINGLYETEVIRRRGPWRTLETVEFAPLEWVDWFNHRRSLEPIGNIPPPEAEARYYARTEDVAMAA
ncbi:Mobile element protein [Azospirillum doebereinerae]